MNLDGALSIASGGLDAISRQLALISHNVANANTAGYARESLPLTSVTADGQGCGVRTGPAVRDLNEQVQSDLFAQSATVAGLQTRQAALNAVNAALGTPGQGNDLPSLVGKLRDAFSALSTDPSNQTSQAAVVTAARSVASGLNTLAQTIGAQRQSAQDSLVSEVGQLNASLATVGQLTAQITRLAAAGQSTADLESQRDVAMQHATQLAGVQWVRQASGGVLAQVGGATVPLDAASGPFSIAAATAGANATYPGTLPGLMLGGADVTAQVTSGQVGANIALRDSVLPTAQAGLDELAHTLATRFDAQGLRLFSDANGNLPAAAGPGQPVQQNYVGFAGVIQVNPVVAANPALVRDGTQAVTGSASGASSFTPNPPGGPAGFGTLIQRVLNYSFGSEVQSGVAQPAPATSGLGASGNLSTPYATSGTLTGLASDYASAQAQASSDADNRVQTETAVQTTLQTTLSASAAVSVDDEMAKMVQLQNAYGANARIIAAAQAMWDSLLGAVSAQ